MSSQPDLFALAPPPPRAAPAPIAPPIPPARPVQRPSPAAERLAGLTPASVAAIAGITLLDELDGDRVALGPVGWKAAMEHRATLVRHQITRSLTPGDAEALAALSRLQIAWQGQTPAGAIIVAAHDFESLQNALAGLRCAMMEPQDG